MQILPEDIPLLLEKFDDNIDLVCGVRGRRSDPLIRRLGSRFVSDFLSDATGAKMDGGFPGFIALRRELAQNACRFDQQNSFLIGTIAWLSVGRIASVTVRHESRKRGKSKYDLRKLTELTFNLICNFSLAPLRLFELIQRVESKFGRLRQGKNHPRTIDLDILFYEKECLQGPPLTVPHPRLHE
ncbi:MAG: 2-amino-4-hydroxy-6-hydroxymethyldihydropteridine diphosphokinase, partial [Planctomycetes bacterium]|nr:2-amino-4-hydroxy-6-hydroxymethyldihydropteridine diphosphokinase [Planctomycetota bacterium]